MGCQCVHKLPATGKEFDASGNSIANNKEELAIVTPANDVFALLDPICEMLELVLFGWPSGITQNRPVRVTSKPANGEVSGH